jgi:hypoxanthine phosphoribosyltransferase
VYEDDIESVLLTEEQVQGKVRDLAAQVSKDYAGRDVLLVGVLKGAFILMADLARHLTVPHEFDFTARPPRPRAWCASSRTSTARSRAATC